MRDPIENQHPPSWAWYPWLGLIVGVAVLGRLYLQASQIDVSHLFERFWLGMFVFYIPAFWRLLSPQTSRAERLILLAGIALFSYVPKLFRCPDYFCYSDELTWWRSIQTFLRGGGVLMDNPLGLIQGKFPGLPLLTLLLQKASSLSTFEAGLLIIGVVRVLTVLAIFLLGEKFFRSSRIGAAAALVYLTNANFLFFSSQFSYESLAVPLLIVILLILEYLMESQGDRSRLVWRLILFTCIAAIVVTHHLATYMLIGIFILILITVKVLPRFSQPDTFERLMGVTFFALLAAVGWIWIGKIDVIDYLGDPISRGIAQIAMRTIRKLFGGITLPWYEIVSGYASAVLIVLLALAAVYVILRKKPPLSSMQIGLLALGALYVVAAPLVLTPWGAESGRRSWVYSYIGMSLLAGFALDWFAGLDRIGNLRYRRIGLLCSTAALAVLLLGGTAASTSISYRFPGPYLQNSDARSFTPEIIAAAQWMFKQVGSDQRVLGDRTTERVFGSYGLQEPAMYGGPRPWEVFFPTSWTPEALFWLEEAQASFIVIDKRMAELPPQMDFRFQRNEPANSYTDRPIPVESVEKFDRLPSLDRVYDSGNIRIYRDNARNPGLLTSGATTIYSPITLPVEIEEPPVGGFNIGFEPLFILLQCLLLIVGVLILPGYWVGRWLLIEWDSLEILVRLTLAITISISVAILSTTLLAFILTSAEKAVGIFILILGLLFVYKFIGVLEQISQNPRLVTEYLAILRSILNHFRTSRTWAVYSLGLISILLVILWMGEIQPRSEPRTELALEITSFPPRVHITNFEDGSKTYELVSSGEMDLLSHTQQVTLEHNQTIDLDLGLITGGQPSRGKVILDLFLKGQDHPYRSIFFSLPISPEEGLLHRGISGGN